jgi:hypothetical protein
VAVVISREYRDVCPEMVIQSVDPGTHNVLDKSPRGSLIRRCILVHFQLLHTRAEHGLRFCADQRRGVCLHGKKAVDYRRGNGEITLVRQRL